MTSIDSLILLISCLLVMVLMVFNVCQWLLARREIEPLEAKTTERNIFVVSSVALVVLLVTHLATSFMTGKGVGTNDLLLISLGVLATVFAVLSTYAFFAKNSLGDKAEMYYYSFTFLMWAFVVAHIFVRGTL